MCNNLEALYSCDHVTGFNTGLLSPVQNKIDLNSNFMLSVYITKIGQKLIVNCGSSLYNSISAQYINN